MNFKLTLVILATILFSCVAKKENAEPLPSPVPVIGTWRLLTGTLIEKGDTSVTDFTKNVSFIKIINNSHFAFLQHDLHKGKDSMAIFVAGGGHYSLQDSLYTEHLEYCSDRNWEDNEFRFTVEVKNDTLVQTGVEKVESEGINRINIEKYVRVKE